MEYVWNMCGDIYGDIYDMMTGSWLNPTHLKNLKVNFDDYSQ